MSRFATAFPLASLTSPAAAKARNGGVDMVRAPWAAIVPAGMAVVTTIGTVLDHLLSAHERWCQRQALSRLDDHRLKDIGLSRADVEREISKPIWRT